ncbi:hypothetical protein V2J09_004501 [Rumex salicifolius]
MKEPTPARGEGSKREEGGSEASGSKGESTVVISQDHKVVLYGIHGRIGQDVFTFAVNNIETANSYQFADLFTSQSGVSSRNGKVNIGTDFKATAFFPEASSSTPLANGREIFRARIKESEEEKLIEELSKSLTNENEGVTENDDNSSNVDKVGLDDIEKIKLVGQGAFGKVYQVKKKGTSEIYAMKIKRKDKIMEKNHAELYESSERYFDAD